jgi:hypothetical protein
MTVQQFGVTNMYFGLMTGPSKLLFYNNPPGENEVFHTYATGTTICTFGINPCVAM